MIGAVVIRKDVTVTGSRGADFNWASVFLFKQNEAPERKDDEEQTTKWEEKKEAPPKNPKGKIPTEEIFNTYTEPN